MAGRAISVKQWAAELRALWGRGFGAGFEAVAQRGLKAAGQRALPLLMERSDQLAFFDGYLKRGWRADVEGLRLVVHNLMPYAGVVEEGRRPGSRPPPVEALVPWVQRKLAVVPFGPRQKGARRPDAHVLARSVAFLVARSIGRRGIPGKHVLGGVVNQIADFVREEVAGALRSRLGGGHEGGGAG